MAMYVPGYKPLEDVYFAGGVTAFTLPGSALVYPDGFVIQVIDDTGSFGGASMVVSAGSGSLVDGAASVTLNTSWQMRTFRRRGVNWV